MALESYQTLLEWQVHYHNNNDGMICVYHYPNRKEARIGLRSAKRLQQHLIESPHNNITELPKAVMYQCIKNQVTENSYYIKLVPAR